jgi:hypothetical protein
MRNYGMYDATRGLTLALFVGVAGVALWGAAQVGTTTTGRFWIAMAMVAGAGLALALINQVGTWTKGLRLRLAPGAFVLGFLPVLVCAGWILVATQPGSGWQEGKLDSWSTSIGILGVVHALGLWHGVLAFGLGLMLGLSVDGVPATMLETEPAYAPPAQTAVPPASDEPTTAERRWTRRRPGAPTPQTGQTTEVRERTQAH